MRTEMAESKKINKSSLEEEIMKKSNYHFSKMLIGTLGLVAIATIMVSSLIILSPASIKSFAQEESENEASSSSSESVNVDLIKQRLAKSQVMGKQAGETKHAKVGKVTRANNEAITIEATSGETVILPLEKALLLNEKEEVIGVDKVVIDNWLTALGYLDESDNFTPTYLIVASDSLLPKNQVVTTGSISKISNKSFELSPRSDPDSTTNFVIIEKTEFQDADGNPIEVKDLDEDIQVLVAGFSESNINEAITVRSLAPKESSKEPVDE